MPLFPIGDGGASVFGACINQCTLARFDAPTQSLVPYPSAAFGDVLLGGGYKLHNPTPTTYQCTFLGVADGVPEADGTMTDMWISLPGDQHDGTSAGGMHWIGHPFNHTVSTDRCLILDPGPGHVWTITQAVDLGLIEGLWNYMEADTQTVRTAGLASLGAYDTWLRPTHAYEIRTHKDNLAFIVPAYPVPEPCSALALAFGSGWVLLRRQFRARA